MGAFRDNDRNRNKDSNNRQSDNAGQGFVYPGSADFDSNDNNSGASGDFEYGDASVAGEYEVKESAVFKYGDGSVPETIGAYYGNETRQDRYAKGDFNEGYGYETVPEVDYSQVVNEQLSAEYGAEQPMQEPQNVEEGNVPEYNSAAPNQDNSGNYGYHESQADELDSVRASYDDTPYKYDTDEDPNISLNGLPFIEAEEAEEENMSSLPVNRVPNTRLTLSIVVGAVAIAGIIGIFCFAFFFDSRKTNENIVAGYEVPTTKEEVTTAAEATPAATDTPTPAPTATPTPEPTATPVPTNTPTPKPQTPVYWPVAKKATPTPTTAPTDETTGEGGSGEGGSGEGGSGEGGSGEGGSGEGGSGGSEGGSGGSEGGGEGGSGGSEGGSGEGGGNEGGSGGSEGGNTTTPPAPGPDTEAEANP